MGIRVRVALRSLKSAFRRLSVRLPDESDATGDFVLFSAKGNSLEILAGGTFESLAANLVSPGRATVPYNVFGGLSRALRFYRKRTVDVVFSQGSVTIDRTDYRHPGIAVWAGGE